MNRGQEEPGSADSAAASRGDTPLFDSYSHDYDAALSAGLSYTGETAAYFARGRLEWLRRELNALGHRSRLVVDYGCGLGSSSKWYFDILGASELLGIDISVGLLERARSRHGSDRARFRLRSEAKPSAQADLVFCNGVFHHIPLAQRQAELTYVWETLRPGGLFAFWDNNPWNPATRFIMSRVAFDTNAETISAPRARKMLKASGFEIVRTDFLFIFPRFLKSLRFLERFLCRLPLGGQYLVLGRRPLAQPGG